MIEVDGDFKLAGVVGNPVRASLSPLLHNRAYRHLGLKVLYLAFQVAPSELAVAVKALRALNFLGVNVTIPYKEVVVGLLDRLSSEAAAIGAVNTIKVEGEELVGYNTDGQGFLRSLEEVPLSAAGKKILIIGAGGAARAIAAVMKEAEEVWVVNRTGERAALLVEHLQLCHSRLRCEAWERLADPSFVKSFHLVVNTTPPEARIPFPFEALPEGALVCDLAYRSGGTEFLSRAMSLSIGTLGGLGMLIHQAALSFQVLTGMDPPHAIMREAVKSEF